MFTFQLDSHLKLSFMAKAMLFILLILTVDIVGILRQQYNTNKQIR